MVEACSKNVPRLHIGLVVMGQEADGMVWDVSTVRRQSDIHQPKMQKYIEKQVTRARNCAVVAIEDKCSIPGGGQIAGRRGRRVRSGRSAWK